VSREKVAWVLGKKEVGEAKEPTEFPPGGVEAALRGWVELGVICRLMLLGELLGFPDYDEGVR
jgi:hypothetical protein